MEKIWLDGLTHDYYSGVSGGMSRADVEASRARREAQADTLKHNADLRELQHHIERLALMNQALWELLCEKTGWTDADLAEKAREVDLRDGVEDGKMSTVAVKCPKCMRVCNSKHHKCLYCGQLFEKPLFG